MTTTDEQRIALVTGASRGIGRAIAKSLQEAGFIVVGTATTENCAKNIEAELAAAGGGGVVLNVTISESVQEALKDIQERFVAPTVLVNNAGITQDNIIMRMNEEDWDSVIDHY